MGLLHLEIISPERLLVQEEVDMVEAQGPFGEFGILPGHIQFLTTLHVGEIRYMKDGKTTYLATSGGIAEVLEDRVTFLVESAEFADEINIDRAKDAQEKAEAMLKELTLDDKDYKVYEEALKRALTRISVASKAV